MNHISLKFSSIGIGPLLQSITSLYIALLYIYFSPRSTSNIFTKFWKMLLYRSTSFEAPYGMKIHLICFVLAQFSPRNTMGLAKMTSKRYFPVFPGRLFQEILHYILSKISNQHPPFLGNGEDPTVCCREIPIKHIIKISIFTGTTKGLMYLYSPIELSKAWKRKEDLTLSFTIGCPTIAQTQDLNLCTQKLGSLTCQNNAKKSIFQSFRDGFLRKFCIIYYQRSQVSMPTISVF